MSAPACRAARSTSPRTPISAIEPREPEPEPELLRLPADDHQRPQALEQVRDRVLGRDRAEPLVLDQLARQRARRQEQEHEEQREHALHRLARPVRSPMNAPSEANASAISIASTIRHHAPEARLDVQPGGEADGEVDQAPR